MNTNSSRAARFALRVSVRALLTAFVGASGLSTPAWAQNNLSQEAAIPFEIPAQSLAGALTEYARQADVSVLFSAEDLRGLNAPALSGQFTRRDALDRLLAGTPYRAELGADTVRLVEDAARPQRADDTQSGAEMQADLVVTGTRIRGAAPAGSNLITVDREEITESGRNTLQDVLQTLPQVFPGSQGELTQLNSTAPGGNFALGSSVDLRGLGSDATLTLLNGRRLAPAGLGTFVDISAIPLAAIERIDVLADGASATYGADAVGGVVNVVLRRDIEHAETIMRIGVADGMDETGFSHAFGHDWSSGSLIAGYEYRHRDALAAADRDYAASNDLRRFGGSNFTRSPASPGNIIRVGPTPVTLAIPGGQNGLTLDESDLLVGQVNVQNGNQDAFLLPEQESHSVFASFRQDLSGNVSLFLDVLGSQREAHAERAQVGTTIVVPETNYYRQQNGLFTGNGPLFLSYFFGNDFGPQETDTRSRTWAAAGGAAFELGGDWRLEASVAYAIHDDTVANSNIADTPAISAALASSNIATAFNPFGDGGDTPASALGPLTFGQRIRNDSDLVTYALRADGGLFELPGGRARIAFGVERREETFSVTWREIHAVSTSNLFVQQPGERTTDAIYAEAFLPILDTASISLSLRQEDSSDFGDAVTPKVGLQWTVIPDLTLRATWGTSFKAPSFRQLLGGTGITIGSLPAIFDPNATNGSTGLLDINGANPNLEPEEAETWTAGFAYEPAWFEGIRFSATYFDIDFVNRIGTPGFILDAFQNPDNYVGYLIRNPTPQQIADALALTSNISGAVPPDGIEAIFDERLTNLATLRVRGVDLTASYAFPTQWGEVSMFASASGLFEFSRQSNQNAPSTDLVDTILNPIDWRVRAGVTLDADTWRAGLTINYADAYDDNLSAPRREIASWTTYDARYTRRFNIRDDGAATEIAIDVRNLTDEDPPFANNPIGMGFDTLNASPVGRVVMVELRQQW